MKTVLISCITHEASYYCRALKYVGVNPVVSHQMEDEHHFDGLLLPGGGDISPIFYHRKNRGSENICITEDILQILLFHRFLEEKKPILGICRGMQLINVALGGNLIQDLPTKKLHAYDHADRYHTTKALSGSRLHFLYGNNCITNSAHHQAVNQLGEHLHITQYAHDGVSEAIEHETLPIVGVQWHPERMCPFLPDSPLSCRGFPANGSPFADGSKLFSWFAGLL